MCSKTQILLAIITCLVLIGSAVGQTPTEINDKIVRSIDAGDFAGALTELRSLKTSAPEIFVASNYDYLTARLSEQAGDIAEAQANYQAVASRKSLLAGYALWHLAQQARATGDLVLERERLRQFLATQSNETLRTAALLRLGESLTESGEHASVVSTLQSLTTHSNPQVSRKAQLLTAQALQADNKTTAARDLFNRILMKMTDASRPDDFALEAVRALDSIDNNSKPVLTEADHLLRASVYQFNRHWDEARNHYLTVVQSNSQSPTVPNALYQIGRGLYQQQHYEEALDYFRRVFSQYQNESARDALAYAAGSYNRLKRTDDAIATYRQYINRFPDAPAPERPYLNIIDALHEAGRYQEALNWVAQTRAKFAGQLAASLALFAQLRIHMAQAQWAAAVSDADELEKASDLGGARVPGGTTRAEILFLQGFSLEQLGKLDDAIELYLSIPDGRNEYFGQLATARLRSLAAAQNKNELETKQQELLNQARAASRSGQQDVARQFAQNAWRISNGRRDELLQLLSTAYQSLPAYKLPALRVVSLSSEQTDKSSSADPVSSAIADSLLFLQLYDEAIPAYLAAAGTQNASGQATSPSDKEYTVALFALRGGVASIAVRFAERVWRNVPADYVLELAPREFVDFLYPIPYRQSVLRYGESYGVDPRFILSIARQESRFQPEAKSVAAARGMMQFIAETAEQMARELGKKDFQLDELYNPDTAIQFGANYLGSLFKQFPGQPEAVAASYNGGAENMARWIARSRSTSPERYVAEIGFAQTKDYVFRVMTNYHAYKQFYDSKLQRTQKP